MPELSPNGPKQAWRTEIMNSVNDMNGRRVTSVIRTTGRKLVLALTGVALTITPAFAQDADVAGRLAGRLPAEVEARVLERIAAAEREALPAQGLVDLALQGVAKGRSAEEVLAALDAQFGTLTRAREALATGGRAPAPSEVEAAGLAMRMGVDATAVSELARSRPDGRSLEVPLLVLGGLSERGLPSDEALGRVLERMAARVDDAGLLAELPGAGMPGAFPGRAPVDVPAGPFGSGETGRGVGGPPSGVPAPAGPAGGVRPVTPPVGGPGTGTPTPPVTPGGA